MQIGFDLTFADINQAGTGIYVGSLAKALTELNTCSSIHFFSARQTRDISKPKSLHTRLDTLYRDLVWMHAALPLKAWQAGVDVLHMPTGIIPLLSPAPVVLTILDTILFQMPESFPTWQRHYFQAMGPRSAQHADRILTISEQSKRDIIRQFNVASEKVTVTYLAAGPEFRSLPQENSTAVRQLYGLGERFILTVGGIEPRKNLGRLLEAFAKLRCEGCPYQLVHVGPKGWHQENLTTKIDQLGLQGSVRFLGLLPLADLVAIYNAASLFVYPSLYEGFGLPILEAMACGCPVVTSNTSSMPEVAGDAAVLVDPYQVDTITKGITEVLENPTLAAELRQRGWLQARRFSWQQTTLETLKVYHEVAGR